MRSSRLGLVKRFFKQGRGWVWGRAGGGGRKSLEALAAAVLPRGSESTCREVAAEREAEGLRRGWCEPVCQGSGSKCQDGRGRVPNYLSWVSCCSELPWYSDLIPPPCPEFCCRCRGSREREDSRVSLLGNTQMVVGQGGRGAVK